MQRAAVRHVLTYDEQAQLCEALFLFKPDLRADEAVAVYQLLFEEAMVGSAVRRAREKMSQPKQKTGTALERERWVRAYRTVFPNSSATEVRRACGRVFGTEMRQDVVDEVSAKPLPLEEAQAILRAAPEFLRDGAVRQPTMFEEA